MLSENVTNRNSSTPAPISFALCWQETFENHNKFGHKHVSLPISIEIAFADTQLY